MYCHKQDICKYLSETSIEYTLIFPQVEGSFWDYATGQGSSFIVADPLYDIGTWLGLFKSLFLLHNFDVIIVLSPTWSV